MNQQNVCKNGSSPPIFTKKSLTFIKISDFHKKYTTRHFFSWLSLTVWAILVTSHEFVSREKWDIRR